MSSEKDDSKDKSLDPNDLNPGDLDPIEKPQETKPIPRSRFWNSFKRAAATYKRRLVVREAIVGEIPYVDLAVAGYETLRFGKQVYHFIKKEQRLERLSKPIEFIKEKLPQKPYYLKAEKERLIKRAAENSKIDMRDSAESIHRKTTEPSEFSRPSMLELLSKAGNHPRFQLEEKRLLNEASVAAKDFEKNYMEGTAQQKYQYLITKAREGFEENYFNRVYHPKRVLRLEKFAAQRLYIDGHSVAEIHAAIKEKSPFMRGIANDIIDESQKHFRGASNDLEYLTKVADFSEKRLDKVTLDKARAELSRWRKVEGIPQFDRRTPRELEKAKSQWERKFVREFAEKSEKHMNKNFLEAYEMLEKYKANPAMKLTTKEEYQVELGRRLSLNDLSKYNIREHDKDIAETLIFVGHKGEEVSKALQEKGLKMETEYGEKIIREVYEKMKHNRSVEEFFNTLREYKKENSILHDETRLDKLGLEYKQSQQQRGITQTHSRNNPDNSLKRDSPDNSLEH